MKKIKLVILILTVFSLSLSLYGCANKYNSVPLRSVKYYKNHQKQMAAMNKKCNKIFNERIRRFNFYNWKLKFYKTNLGKDCFNASQADFDILIKRRIR